MTPQKDQTNGDHSVKKWFWLMNENTYITLCAIALMIFIWECLSWESLFDMLAENYNIGGFEFTFAIIFVLIAPAIIVSIVLLGFIKFWKSYIGKGK